MLKVEEPKAKYADASIAAFEDTWHWLQPPAADELRDITKTEPADIAALMQALYSFLGENDMMAYLIMMCNRLLEIRRVHKATGSLYLHCDPTASHYLKLVLDGVLRSENFLNEIIWKRTGAHSGSERAIKRVMDRLNIVEQVTQSRIVLRETRTGWKSEVELEAETS